MDFDQLNTFLVLSDELHFGRTAERLYVSQSRVSRLIASLEAQVGGVLFDRTSRRVRLTPLGAGLRSRLEPAYAEMRAALDSARRAAGGTAGGLHLGCTAITNVPVVSRLLSAFRGRYPECQVRVEEINFAEPYAPLRCGIIDVLVNWLAVDEPDLTVGPVLAYHDRVLAVAPGHRLASRPSVSVEDMADEDLDTPPPSFPAALGDAIFPPRSASGRPIHRTVPILGIPEWMTLVSSGRCVHPTMAGLPIFARDDIVLVPITDLPPLALGLIWCTAHENARIRALAEVARAIAPVKVKGVGPPHQRDRVG